jgi:aminoglycoside phosphotransferase (APT) family kinase protein
VDFETAGRGDPDFDLVGLACTLDLDADRIALLYRGAGRKPPVSPRLRELKRLFALREHAWALARIAEGRTEGTIAWQRDTSLGVLRNLSTGN